MRTRIFDEIHWLDVVLRRVLRFRFNFFFNKFAINVFLFLTFFFKIVRLASVIRLELISEAERLGPELLVDLLVVDVALRLVDDLLGGHLAALLRLERLALVRRDLRRVQSDARQAVRLGAGDGLRLGAVGLLVGQPSLVAARLEVVLLLDLVDLAALVVDVFRALLQRTLLGGDVDPGPGHQAVFEADGLVFGVPQLGVGGRRNML